MNTSQHYATQSSFSHADEAVANVEYGIGQRVHHQKFGEGIVINYEGQGSHARVEVNFSHAGSKWLVLSYANLQVL